jgi:hypothetical protein
MSARNSAAITQESSCEFIENNFIKKGTNNVQRTEFYEKKKRKHLKKL